MRTPAAPLQDPVDTRTLRAVAGAFATGVTVITCQGPSGPQGCAANAVLSVSLDPPLMLVSLAETSRTRHAIEEAASFCINILPDTAAGHALCTTFAGRDADKFARVSHSPGGHGAPVLHDSLGWLECAVETIHAAGDHTLFLGRVVAATHRDGDPLVFFRGQLRRLDAA